MKRSTSLISVLIVDDHRILRDGLKASLEKDKKISVVHEAANGREAVYLAEKFCPDIVVMDINLPDCTGIEATQQILSNNPAIKVLCLSMHTDKIHVTGMMKAGAAGFLTKTCSSAELSSVIHKVASGISHICDEVIDSVVEIVRTPLNLKEPPLKNPLSRRESQVLKLIAEGHSSATAAELLKISTRTVEQHRKNIMRKLGIKTTAMLTKFAIRQGITFVE